MTRTLLIILGFNATWFAAILGAANGYVWLGPLCVLALSAAVLNTSQDYIRDAALMALAAGMGYVLDSTLVLFGMIAFAEAQQYGGPSPMWMVGMWAAFGVTFTTFYGILLARPFAAALFGLIGGPAAYYAGMRLGALELSDNLIVALIGIGSAYVIAMLVLRAGALKLDGVTARQFEEAPEASQAEASA